MTDILVDMVSTNRFVRDLLTAHGADAAEAGVVAETLIWADLRNQPGQGLCRVPVLIKRLAAGGIVSPCPVEIHGVSRVAECLDGQGGFGHYVGSLAVRRAIELAEVEGLSAVTVRNSNHFGAAGYYAHLAAREGMVALVTSNAYPTVAAPGGRRPVLGTNPLAFAAPREDEESLVIDMGTTFGYRTAAIARAEKYGALEAGIAADPALYHLRDGVLLPPDGKSFALGLIVEVLCGILAGAEYSSGLHSFYREPGKPAGLGHSIICFQVDRFLPIDRFRRRLEHLVKLLAASGDMNPECPTRIPGEKRWAAYRKNAASGVLPLEEETVVALECLARQAGIRPDWRNPCATASQHGMSAFG